MVKTVADYCYYPADKQGGFPLIDRLSFYVSQTKYGLIWQARKVLSHKDILVTKFFRPLQWLSALMSRMLNSKRNY